MLRLLFLLSIATVLISCDVMEDEIVDEPSREEGDKQGHMAVIRPDYTLWKMVKVLKNMFDSRTEKRRQRDLVEIRDDVDDLRSEPVRQQALRARRLLFNL